MMDSVVVDYTLSLYFQFNFNLMMLNLVEIMNSLMQTKCCNVNIDLVLLMIRIVLSFRFIQFARHSIFDCWFLSFFEIKGHVDGYIIKCSWWKVIFGMKPGRSRNYFLRENCDQECHILLLNFLSETLVYNML